MFKKIIGSFIVGLLIGGGIAVAAFLFSGKTEREYRQLIKQANNRAELFRKQLIKERETTSRLKSEIGELTGIGKELGKSNADDINSVRRAMGYAGEIKRELDK